MDFVPLYIRSEYSMLQSTCSIESLVSTASANGCHSLAVTDEGVMYGALKFYNLCKVKKLSSNPLGYGQY